jgi:hypothetical protein
VVADKKEQCRISLGSQPTVVDVDTGCKLPS